MPGGQNALPFIIFGALGAAIVFGVPWLVGAVLPFVGSPRFGSTTGWVLCGIGFFAGGTLAQIGISGWRETWRSWGMWAIIVGSMMGLSAITQLYFRAFPGHLKTIAELGKELGKRVPVDPESLLIISFIGIPILLFVILTAIAICKHYIDERRQRRGNQP